MTSPMSQADIEAQRKALDAVLKNQIHDHASVPSTGRETPL